MKNRLFRQRLAKIREERAARRRQAERLLRSHYRVYRDLPARPIVAMIPRRRLYTLICWAEIEHQVGIARMMLQVSALLDRAAALLRNWL
jgi:hypothetical protein